MRLTSGPLARFDYHRYEALPLILTKQTRSLPWFLLLRLSSTSLK